MALPKDLRDRLRLPAFAAPMFLVSETDLAIACCKAGVIGSLTRNHCRDLARMEGRGIGLMEDIPSVAQLVTRLQRKYIAACAVTDMAASARTALESDE